MRYQDTTADDRCRPIRRTFRYKSAEPSDLSANECTNWRSKPTVCTLPLLKLSAQYVEQGLCDGPVSVRPSVRPIDQQQQRRPAGLLLSAGVCSRYRPTAAGAVLQARRRPAANAVSVMLRDDGGGCTQRLVLKSETVTRQWWIIRRVDSRRRLGRSSANRSVGELIRLYSSGQVGTPWRWHSPQPAVHQWRF